MNADDLERLIDGELKRLPPPRAPVSLLPRVLAATVDRRPSAWPARPWLSWPTAWRTASAAVALSVAVAAMLAWSRLPGWEGLPGTAGLLEPLAQASALVRMSWRMLVEPLAFRMMTAAIVLSLGCAILWSALDRFALGGASEP